MLKALNATFYAQEQQPAHLLVLKFTLSITKNQQPDYIADAKQHKIPLKMRQGQPTTLQRIIGIDTLFCHPRKLHFPVRRQSESVQFQNSEKRREPYSIIKIRSL